MNIIAEPQALPDAPELDAAEAYQLERGKPMPGPLHSRTQSRLCSQFNMNKAFEAYSELNLDLNGWRSVPDICLFPSEAQPDEEHLWVTDVPAIAVEIISPSQTIETMTDKVNSLLRGGVPSVWLVLPEVKVITLFQLKAPLISFAQGIITDPITGITVNVDEVFR